MRGSPKECNATFVEFSVNFSSTDQNLNLSNTLLYDQMPAKLTTFPSASILFVLLVSECLHTITSNCDDEHGKHYTC